MVDFSWSASDTSTERTASTTFDARPREPRDFRFQAQAYAPPAGGAVPFRWGAGGAGNLLSGAAEVVVSASATLAKQIAYLAGAAVVSTAAAGDLTTSIPLQSQPATVQADAAGALDTQIRLVGNAAPEARAGAADLQTWITMAGEATGQWEGAGDLWTRIVMRSPGAEVSATATGDLWTRITAAGAAKVQVEGAGKFAADWWTIRPVTGEWGFPSEEAGAVEKAIGGPWQDIPRQDRRVAGAWADAPSKKAGVASPWRLMVARDQRMSAPWGHLDTAQAAKRLPYRAPGAKDDRRTAPWGPLDATQEATRLPYRQPPPQDQGHALPFAAFKRAPGQLVAFPYAHPPANDRRHRAAWGPQTYPTECWKEYRPPAGGDVRINLHEPRPAPDWEQSPRDYPVPAFNFDALQRCYQPPPGGNRDRYAPDPPPREDREGDAVGHRKVYFIMSDAELRRQSDGKPIEALSISLDLDVDSWAWDFSATIPASALELVEPGSSGPVEVRAHINGYVWHVLVEQYSRSRAFGKASVNLSGRSLTAYLATPYAPAGTRTTDADRDAQQLAADELDYTGFGLNWQTEDWLVPAGALSYEGKAPVSAIREIAGAAGAVVQPARATKELTVLPRYPVSPWDWSGAEPDVTLPDSLVVSDGLGWEPGPDHNGVWVMGEQQGVAVRVVRDGTAGDKMAKQVVDPLVTEFIVGRERGRNELAAAGNKASVDLETPLVPAPDTPGLIEPGALLELDATSPWRGLVMGTSISAKVGNGGAVTIRQKLTVERHYA